MCLTKSLFSAAIAATTSVSMAASITPLTSFGGGDGWLAPGEGGYTYLGTGNNERGLAYGNNHLYLVSRSGGNNIRILDASTGADLGALSTPASTITGGTNAINTVAVGGDGVIYVNNLTTQSTTSPLKIYAWASESSNPTIAYSGNAGLAGSRAGDSLAAFGSGANTRLAVGYGSTPAITGNNGYAIIDPTAGSATAVAFTTNPPAAGDFRLGITFVDANRVLGSQSNGLYRNTTFSGSTGTLTNSVAIPDPATGAANRLLAATVIDGVSILAVQSVGDGHVSIYNINNAGSPIYLGSARAQTGTSVANTNGTGQLAWNYSGTGQIATLYAMNTNNGIQAFTFELPEPASLAMLAGVGVVALRRRKGH